MISGETKEYIRAEMNSFKADLGDHLAQSVKDAVKLTVNGKVDRLSEEVKEINLNLLKMNPVVDFYNNLSFFNRSIFWLLKIIASLGTAFGVIWGATVFIRSLFKL